MLQQPAWLTSGVKTTEFPESFGKAEQAAEKSPESLSSGAKAHAFRGLCAGAEASAS
jgi:hypothetical protein